MGAYLFVSNSKISRSICNLYSHLRIWYDISKCGPCFTTLREIEACL